MMGGHLPNSEGNIIGDGDDVVQFFDDIKIKTYDMSKCMRMKNILRTIELMRRRSRGAYLCHTPCSGGSCIYVDGGQACT